MDGLFHAISIRNLRYLFALAAAAWSLPLAGAAEAGWPREITTPEGEIVMYQPQLETFDANKLTARAAVSVTPAGKTEPVFGAVWLAARVATDRDTRMVTLLDVEVPDARFHNATQEQLDKLAGILKREIPKWNLTVSLDRLLAALELVEREQATAGQLNTKPPKILFVTHPAALVSIDGKPELRPVENSKLMRVVNTPFLIVLDPDSTAYYLKAGDEWRTSPDIMGSWQSASSVPAAVSAIVAEDVAGEAEQTADEPNRNPQIIVATEPTELIVSDGEPTYTPIEGTGLLFMSNTESDVLMEVASQKHFVLLAGRWFGAPSLDGPWSYVASDKLPVDFAKIPPDSDQGYLLAHVAGTEEAQDAVNDTYIPQTAEIDRSEATVEVEYDGSPEFGKIEGTDLEYAVNTPYDIIRVGDKYYCCHEGVWYVAEQPTGPWMVCVSVPRVIYTIPPSCPVYPVTYVYVYNSTPTTVYVGYMPGYVGCYAYGGTVVYGTGYVYGGWCGTVYYPRPPTFGFSVHYNPVTGSWGFGVGYRGSNGWVGGSVHGGWWGHGHRYPTRTRGGFRGSRNINVGGNRNINVGDVNIGNQVAVGDRNNIYKRSTNVDRNARRPGSSDRTRAVERPGGADQRGGALRPGGTGRPGTIERPGSSPATRQRPNDVFADRDGNVHRRTKDGWEQRTGSGWTQSQRTTPPSDRKATQADRRATPPRRPAAQPSQPPRKPDRAARPSPSSRQPQSLDRENRARERGTQRTNDFRRSQKSGSQSRKPARSAPRGRKRGR